MTALTAPDRRARPDPTTLPDDAPPRCGWGMVGLLLGGYLLFAHGCHGDEDNELFARAVGVFTVAPADANR